MNSNKKKENVELSPLIINDAGASTTTKKSGAVRHCCFGCIPLIWMHFVVLTIGIGLFASSLIIMEDNMFSLWTHGKEECYWSLKKSSHAPGCVDADGIRYALYHVIVFPLSSVLILTSLNSILSLNNVTINRKIKSCFGISFVLLGLFGALFILFDWPDVILYFTWEPHGSKGLEWPKMLIGFYTFLFLTLICILIMIIMLQNRNFKCCINRSGGMNINNDDLSVTLFLLMVFLPITWFLTTVTPALWHNAPGNWYPSGFYSWVDVVTNDTWTINVAVYKDLNGTTEQFNSIVDAESFYLKIFGDILVYYLFLFIIVILALCGYCNSKIKHFFYQKRSRFFINVSNDSNDTNNNTNSKGGRCARSVCSSSFLPSNGELIFSCLLVILTLIEGYYWFFVHSYHPSEHANGQFISVDRNWKENTARAFGVLGAMFFALNFIPMARSSKFTPYSYYIFYNLGLSNDFLFLLHKTLGVIFVLCGLCHFGFWELFLVESGNIGGCPPFDLWPCNYSPNNPAINMQYFLFTFITIPVYGIFTNYYIRRKLFELFYYMHLIGTWIVSGGLLWHANQFIYFLYPTLTFYIFDRIYRYLNSGVQWQLTSVANVNNDKNIVELRFKRNGNDNVDGMDSDLAYNMDDTYLHSYVRNDYCYIKIDDISLFEWHPCSIFDYNDQNGEYRAIFKQNGGFTQKLNELGDLSNVLFHCDGIYYKRIDYRLYNNCIFLVGGGIGVTPIHYLLKQLMLINANFNIERKNKVKHIVFIWYYRNDNLYHICQSTLNVINSDHANVHSNIHTRLFCTSTLGDRPSLSDIIESECSSLSLDVNDANEMQKCIIYGCGPQSMINSLKNVAARFQMAFDCESFEL